jgi:hypothetical protein
VTEWRRSPVIATLVVVVYLAVQIVMPTTRLWDDGPRRFGWQMYSVANVTPTFVVTTADGQTAIDYDDYLANGRVDIDVVTNLPPHLCETIPGAEQVRWQDGSYEC